jgi:hypothetical protein
MASSKVVFVAWLNVPTESTLRGGPVHKVEGGFTADRVRRHAILAGVNPLRANTNHKLRFL